MRLVAVAVALSALLGGAAGTEAAVDPGAPGTAPGAGLLVLSATFDEPGAGVGRLAEWAGWPAERTLRVTLANIGTGPVDDVSVHAGFTGGAAAALDVGPLAAGEMRTVDTPLRLPAGDFGRHVAYVDVGRGGLPPIQFTAATSTWPWLTMAIAAFALAWVALSSIGPRRPYSARAVGATAWTAVVFAVGIAATTVATARRADATAEAAQADLARALEQPVRPAADAQAGATRRAPVVAAEPAGRATGRRPLSGLAAPPELSAPALGDAMGVLRVPRFGDGYRFVAVEGVRDRDLAAGPGHYPGTALAGEVGNFVLSGHRTSHQAPFAELDELVPGDTVLFDAGGGTFTYRVLAAKVVEPTALEVLLPVPGEPGAAPEQALLTLITCHPEHSTSERLVVTAEFVSFELAATAAITPAT